MEINNNNQYIGFGLNVVNRFSRNWILHSKDTFIGFLSTIKHKKVSPMLSYRHNAHKLAEVAYQQGCRIFDTARIYGYSEYELGLMMSSHDREELFICTKVSDMDLTRKGGADSVRGNLMNSLKDLGTDYIDLYLLHWPSGDWVEMYKQMNALYQEGLIRYIGVSNFKVSDFKKLSEEKDITEPQFCQIECHPFCMNKEVLNYCRDHNIVVIAHSPTGRMTKEIKSNEMLSSIANSHKKSIPQIILRWHIQCGRIPITHTKKVEHLKENMDIFDFSLTEDEIRNIDSLNQEKSLFHFVGIDNSNYKYNR